MNHTGFIRRSGRALRAVRTIALAAALVLGGQAWSPAAQAEGPRVVKIATIAPKGSIYHRKLQEIGEAFRARSGPEARFIVYTDSSHGTEADTVRRMRIGQLDGSMLTVVGLSEIDPAVTALQLMPMMFRTWGELDFVREKLRPELEARLAAKGFVVLMWGEGGWVQFFTKDRISRPEQFKQARIFVWAGDNTHSGIMKTLGYRPVSLPLSDILPGLETGMIDAVPVAPLWALAGQFDQVTRYMLPVNWVPIVGATVFRKQTWDAFSPAAREAVAAAAAAADAELRAHRVVQDEESIRAMQKRGLTVQPLTLDLEQAWQGVAEQAWPQVRGGLVPVETFDRVRELLAEYRGRPQ